MKGSKMSFNKKIALTNLLSKVFIIILISAIIGVVFTSPKVITIAILGILSSIFAFIGLITHMMLLGNVREKYRHLLKMGFLLRLLLL
ncbi:hypothetical protein [Mycoplasma sp. CSL7503-lung]|uniref:hypothetical protein n=1 Tax=Mycoplasma sp. CSL7503-lung TaxID=536372 RepID=UPI0021CF4BC8|nr:hypothetical protein [Mycoplasma sp. CSL7503-lung]MCU4706911.1 hypothetical protein [Mycoplasma sp. CSL7503-lung]